MAKIQDILAMERPYQKCIRLYREGIFYKAYEYSALLFTKEHKEYQPKKKFYKVVKQEMVSIGFPTKVIEGLNITEKQITKLGDDLLLSTESEATPEELAAWKSNIVAQDGILSMENVENLLNPQSSTPKQEENANWLKIVEKIDRFPLIESTPMECMQFVLELKNELRGSKSL